MLDEKELIRKNIEDSIRAYDVVFSEQFIGLFNSLIAYYDKIDQMVIAKGKVPSGEKTKINLQVVNGNVYQLGQLLTFSPYSKEQLMPHRIKEENSVFNSKVAIGVIISLSFYLGKDDFNLLNSTVSLEWDVNKTIYLRTNNKEYKL